MKENTKLTQARPDESGPPRDVRTDSTLHDHAPRKLSLAENVILTIKVVTVAAVVIAALWGINVWTSAQ